jgi:predicted DNA-binding transcriptional regulator AlpA
MRQTPDTAAALAFSVQEFCTLHRISRCYFYKLLKQGLAPRLIKIGARTLVSVEAAADWRRERENASQKVAA